jgi:uncharacterized protein YeaO (DUF488 family)
MPTKTLSAKRIYDAPAHNDGARILVDRLWPRGISKERAQLYKWAKDITPSTELRQVYHHGEDNQTEFQAAYSKELDKNPETKNFVTEVKELLSHENVTLLTASKDITIGHVPVIMKYIKKTL